MLEKRVSSAPAPRRGRQRGLRFCAAALWLALACRLPQAQHAEALREQLREALWAGHFASAAQLASELEQAGDDAAAALARITLAERLHDARLLPEGLPAPVPPDVTGALALAVYSTRGLAAASKLLSTTCEGEASAPLRSLSCALAAQARRAEGKPLLVARGAQRASIELLPELRVPAIEASINGLADEPFAIDTGAVSTILSRGFCERAHIAFDTEVPRQALDGAGNPVLLYPTLLERLGVGDITLHNVPVFVMDFPPGLGVAGVLAPLDTFRELSVELDLRGRRVRLLAGQQAELKDWTASWGVQAHSTPLIWEGTHVFVEAELDGSPGFFMLDTAADHNLVDVQTARRLGYAPSLAAPAQPPAPTPPDLTPLADAGRSRGPGVFSALLAVGGAPAERTRFFARRESQPDPEQLFPLRRTGTLGGPWLENRRIWLPPGGRTLVFAAVRDDGF